MGIVGDSRQAACVCAYRAGVLPHDLRRARDREEHPALQERVEALRPGVVEEDLDAVDVIECWMCEWRVVD